MVGLRVGGEGGGVSQGLMFRVYRLKLLISGLRVYWGMMIVVAATWEYVWATKPWDLFPHQSITIAADILLHVDTW